jgi:hypothetical protein
LTGVLQVGAELRQSVQSLVLYVCLAGKRCIRFMIGRWGCCVIHHPEEMQGNWPGIRRTGTPGWQAEP